MNKIEDFSKEALIMFIKKNVFGKDIIGKLTCYEYSIGSAKLIEKNEMLLEKLKNIGEINTKDKSQEWYAINRLIDNNYKKLDKLEKLLPGRKNKTELRVSNKESAKIRHFTT